MIRGIGPVYAKKLVRAFGEKVFGTSEAEPERLREVTGIARYAPSASPMPGPNRRSSREIMVLLHSVGTARVVRIYKTYGADAVQVMTENPYRLALDIRGIGFKTADATAMKLGVEKTAMIRVRAGILYPLTEAMDDGHAVQRRHDYRATRNWVGRVTPYASKTAVTGQWSEPLCSGEWKQDFRQPIIRSSIRM
jgi:exodeoxyribonuclease V alpha subunit